MKKQFVGLIVVLAIILLAVFSFILYNEWPLMTGKKIVLATMPVDPFDPLMGQYMAINYEISRISNAEDFKAGDTIYVLLEKDNGGIWREKGFLKTKPSTGDFIKGKVSDNWGRIQIKYGIESFYFERHANLPTTNITIEVGVASSGRAKLSQMLYNGKPLEIKYEEFDIKS